MNIDYEKAKACAATFNEGYNTAITAFHDNKMEEWIKEMSRRYGADTVKLIVANTVYIRQGDSRFDTELFNWASALRSDIKSGDARTELQLKDLSASAHSVIVGSMARYIRNHEKELPEPADENGPDKGGDIRHNISDEFISRIKQAGNYTASENFIGDITVSRNADGKKIFTVYPDGRFNYAPDAGLEAGKVKRVYDYVRDYVTAYETASRLEYDGVKNYRRLCEFGDVVLAAKKMNMGGYEFVTWRTDSKDVQSVGVNSGNYFSDYAAAKEDFAKRSGLIDHLRYFDKDILQSVYLNIGESIDERRFCLQGKESSDLYRFTAKLKNLFPDIEPRELAEPEFAPAAKCRGRGM